MKEYHPKGKRGIIYKNGNKIIKIANPQSKAKERIQNEGKYLKRLNKYNIGPKIYNATENEITMEYIEGKQIEEALERKNPIPLIKNILNQCYILDTQRINKLEMHKPTKHIIVKGNKATLIDFERCYETKKPKNVTQCIQYFQKLEKRNKYNFTIEKKYLRKVLQEYKRNYDKEGFNKIIKRIRFIRRKYNMKIKLSELIARRREVKSTEKE